MLDVYSGNCFRNIFRRMFETVYNVVSLVSFLSHITKCTIYLDKNEDTVYTLPTHPLCLHSNSLITSSGYSVRMTQHWYFLNGNPILWVCKMYFRKNSSFLPLS